MRKNSRKNRSNEDKFEISYDNDDDFDNCDRKFRLREHKYSKKCMEEDDFDCEYDCYDSDDNYDYYDSDDKVYCERLSNKILLLTIIKQLLKKKVFYLSSWP